MLNVGQEAAVGILTAARDSAIQSKINILAYCSVACNIMNTSVMNSIILRAHASCI